MDSKSRVRDGLRRLPVALPAAVLLGACLLPAQAAGTRSHGDIVAEGRMEVHIGDDFANNRAYYFYFLVTDEGERLPLDVGGRGAEVQALAGEDVRVTGALRDGRLNVSSLDHAASSGGAPEAAQAGAGEKKVIVILFNFQHYTWEPWTIEEVRSMLDTDPDSINAYYQEQSAGVQSLAGKVNPDGDIFGWYTIPYEHYPCNYGLWQSAANDAAVADGVDLSGYDNYLYVWPHNNCPWYALGQVGGPLSWYNGTVAFRIVAHELGHNYGAGHASSYDCVGGEGEPVTLSQDCTIQEYGDPFTNMGVGYTRHWHNWHKVELGFLPQANVLTLDPGSYILTLAPSEQPLEGQIQAIRIPRTVDSSEGIIDYYYLEFRQPYGTYFDDFEPDDAAVNGVTIRIAPSSGPGSRSFLLDTIPSTSDTRDAPLQAGETFDDPVAHVSIRTVDVSPLGATVEIVIEEDTDGDGLSDPDEELFGTDPLDPDTDDDGCGDGKELGVDEMLGGRRDPNNSWDYFNPTNDGQNRVDDVLAVLNRYFLAEGEPGYDEKYDRSSIPETVDEPWRLGPPEGQVLVDDVLHALGSYFHDCGTGVPGPTSTQTPPPASGTPAASPTPTATTTATRTPTPTSGTPTVTATLTATPVP